MLFTDILITEANVQIRVCQQVDKDEFDHDEELPHLYQCVQEEAGHLGRYGKIYDMFADEDPRVLRIWNARKNRWSRVLASRFRRIR